MIDIAIPNTISIGPVELHLYGALLGVSFMIIYVEVEKRYKEAISIYLVALALLLTILGARLVFVIHNLEWFLEYPKLAFSISDGGLAYFGAVLGASLSIYIISKLSKLKYFDITDTILLVAPLAQSIGRIGNFINQELYGLPSKLPWSIYISPENRLPGYESFASFHPTFLYEIILNLVSYGILRGIKNNKIRGTLTGVYLTNYGVIRLLINRIRIDKEYLQFLPPLSGLIETSDLFSILFIIVGVYLLVKLHYKSTTS